jgi:hypothetical protein
VDRGLSILVMVDTVAGIAMTIRFAAAVVRTS